MVTLSLISLEDKSHSISFEDNIITFDLNRLHFRHFLQVESSHEGWMERAGVEDAVVLGDFATSTQNAVLEIPEWADDLTPCIHLVHNGGRFHDTEQHVDGEQL